MTQFISRALDIEFSSDSFIFFYFHIRPKHSNGECLRKMSPITSLNNNGLQFFFVFYSFEICKLAQLYLWNSVEVSDLILSRIRKNGNLSDRSQ